MNSQLGPLRSGQVYTVIREFTDYDGRVHPVGERWVFKSWSFLPYDSGAVLNLQSMDGATRLTRMWWDDAGQGRILDHLELYVVASTGA